MQRVTKGSVQAEGMDRREIGKGLVLLLGISAKDDERVADYIASKAVNLRIFSDEAGNLNRSLLEVGGDCLIVSNFTLYAGCKKGRRPSFTNAALPGYAEPLYLHFVEAVKKAGVGKVQTGEFGAAMQVNIQNDGPVTILLDSAEMMPK